MLKKHVPKWLWDYGIHWVCEVMQQTSSSLGNLQGRTALEELTGETPEISEYLDILLFMTGVGIMTMLVLVRQSWDSGWGFHIE